MERSFEMSFADIRVHCDDAAAALAAGLGAAAFTRGRDIYFGAGRYEPATSSGRLLLAHELAHTVQPHATNTEPVSRPDGPAERTAAEAARRAVAGNRVDLIALTRSPRSTLQRQPATAAPTNQPAPKQVNRFPFAGLSTKDYVDEHVTAVGINLYIGKGVVYLTLDNVKDPVAVDFPEFQAGTVDLAPLVPDKPTLAEARAAPNPDLVKALVDRGMVPCFFYRRAAGLIWPSLLNEQTMPRTMPYLRQVEAAARKDARETAKTFTHLLIWYIGARFPIRTKAPTATAPVAPPAAAPAGAAAELTSAEAGQIIGWGTGQTAEAVAQTQAATRALTTEAIKGMIKRGLTRTWVTEQLAAYERAVATGAAKLKNVQLLPRLELMKRLLELWP
jgi:hypothetical protein